MDFRKDGPDRSSCRTGYSLLRIYLDLFFVMLYYLNAACVFQKQKTKTLHTSLLSCKTSDIENAPHLITVHYSKNPRQYIYSKTNYP